MIYHIGLARAYSTVAEREMKIVDGMCCNLPLQPHVSTG